MANGSGQNLVTQIGESTADHRVALPGHSGTELGLAWAAVTDTGRHRSANEDSFLARSPVFAIADGMGGHAAGDLASDAVVRRLAEAAQGDFASVSSVDRALELATADIEALGGGSEIGVGTTATGAILVVQDGEPYFAVFNIGDSRVYQFERSELSQVTVDHSVVQELVDSGLLDRGQAAHHPESNVITRAVGFNLPASADYWMLALRPGLRLLVCSDGLTKEVNDEALRLQLAAGLSAKETAFALVDAALVAGGRDNVTVIVIDVLETPGEIDLEQTAPRSGVTPA